MSLQVTPDVAPKAITWKYSEKQSDAYESLALSSTKRVLYGGSKGGGKSYFGCMWVFQYAYHIIDTLKLQPKKNPPVLAFMGRKRAVDFNDTTLETWKKAIPEEYYEIRSQDKELVLFKQGDRAVAKIAYGGLDDQKLVNKFQSAEFGYIFIDQAEEISLDEMAMLEGTLRQTVDGIRIPPKVLLTANPEPCWLKGAFVDNPESGDVFVKALPSDNPFLPEDYAANLEKRWSHRPERVRAYVYGDWDVLAADDVVIKPQWIKACTNQPLKVNHKRRLVSCDPARYGDDETVIYVLEDGKMIDQMIFGQKDTMYTAAMCASLKNKYKAELIVVDATGVGGGVCDKLAELNEPVKELNYASRPSTEEKGNVYYNIKSEMYWEAGEMFARGEVSLHDDPLLSQQLVNVKYSAATGKGTIRIESKKDIKARMSGKSPDRADAFVQGLWALQFLARSSDDFNRRNEEFLSDKNFTDPYGWNKFYYRGGPNEQHYERPPIFHEAYANLNETENDNGYGA